MVNPLDQQPRDPRRLSGKRFLLQRIESFQHFPHLSLQNVPPGLPRRLPRVHDHLERLQQAGS